MKNNKRFITACLCLAAAIAICCVTGANFLKARELPMPVEGPGVTEVKMLSDWFEGLKGTHADTPVYVLQGSEPGGKMLILGGTHGNEPSGYMSAFTFIENAKVDKGTVFVIPYTNRSGMTHNDPGEGNMQYFTLQTQSGPRTFRFGSRATNPIDQWPDPDIYTHRSSGQTLSGSETRNLNRCYPGVENGTLSERVAYAVTNMINTEGIDMEIDLHESSPEYAVNNATVAHERAMTIASEGVLDLQLEGISMSLEPSPVTLHGLTHRELGDFTNTYALLMETGNPSQGRLRGRTDEALAQTGIDPCYVINYDLGLLYVDYSSGSFPMELRVGRHLAGIQAYINAFNNNSEKQIVVEGIPTYDEMLTNKVGYYLK